MVNNMLQNGLYISPTEFMEFGSDKPYGVDATRAKSMEGRAWANIMSTLPNPDKVLQNEHKTIVAYKDLLYDAQVSSCIKSRKAGVLALDWEFNKGIAIDEVTRFVKDCFENFDIYDVISKILDAPAYGYAVLESYYIPENGKSILTNIVSKPIDWFSFNQNNELMFLSKENPQGELLDKRKFTVAMHDSDYDNPYGRAVLAQCFWPVTLKKDALKFWIRFCEKYGMPLLWGTVPRVGPKTNKNPADELLEKLEGFGQDGVAVFPEGTGITMLEAVKTSSMEIYQGLLVYCDQQISKAVLSHSAGVDSTPGSLGNEDGALVVREDIVQSDKRIVESTINKIVADLVKLNFGHQVKPPIFEMYGQKEVDMNLANRDAIMFEKFGIKPTDQYLQREYNLLSGDYTFVTSAPAPAFADTNTTDEFADTGNGPGDQVITDKAVESLASGKHTSDAMQVLIDKITETIDGGSSFEESHTLLINLANNFEMELDDSKIQELMTNAIFASKTIGQLSVQKQLGV